MLCFEGIQLMLNIFRGERPSPEYRTVPPPDGKLEVLTAHKEVSEEHNRSGEKMALTYITIRP